MDTGPKFVESSINLMNSMTKLSRLFLVTAFVFVTASCASDTAVSSETTDTADDVDTVSDTGTMPDIENGKATFDAQCSVCHSVQESGGPILGPNLIGVVGRAAASHPGFSTEYSNALKASRLTWSENTLNTFLDNPMAMVPGTFMPMMIKDDQTRADVIAYLASLKHKEE
jgi:cytochrome c2